MSPQRNSWFVPGWWLWQPFRLLFVVKDLKRHRRLKRMSSQELRDYWDWWPEYRDRIDATNPVVRHLDAVLGGRTTTVEFENPILLDALLAGEIQAGRRPGERPWLLDYSVEFPVVMDALRERLTVEQQGRR